MRRSGRSSGGARRTPRRPGSRRAHAALVIALVAGLAAAVPARLAAQEGLDRLDAQTRAAVERVIDSTRAAGLPTEPLLSKALEGASKGAPGPRIVAVVRGYARALAEARRVFGARASEVDVVAGAGALQAGVGAAALAELRDTRGESGLAVPLVVLADLVTRGVPSDTASSAVLLLSRAGASDGDFAALRSNVERDIRAGVPPATAAAVRAQMAPPHLPGRARPRASPADSLLPPRP